MVVLPKTLGESPTALRRCLRAVGMVPGHMQGTCREVKVCSSGEYGDSPWGLTVLAGRDRSLRNLVDLLQVVILSL